MAKIEKHLKETFDLIDRVTQPKVLNMKVGRTKNHAFNGRALTLEKNDRKYSFIVTTKIKKGIQREKEIAVNRETEVELKNEGLTLYTKGKSIHITNISYPDFFESELLEKTIKGELTEITTQRYSYYNKSRYYRIILPVYRKIGLWGDFTGWHYAIDGNPTHETLVKLSILEKEFHFYCYTNKAKQTYIVIDCLSKQSLDKFQLAATSILLAYAFLKGEYHGIEASIITYDNIDFKAPKSLRTVILGGGIYNGFPVHSTKPYSLVQLQNKVKYKKDSQGRIIGFNDEEMKKYMLEFPSESLGKLCELICTKGGVLRAVILFINNNSATLEMKIPTLFVALENVTKVLIGGDKSVPKLVTDETVIKHLKAVVKTAVKEISVIERNNKPEGLTSQEEKDYKATFARISSKFHDFNKGTNNAKLIEPFIRFGYSLSQEEENLIFKYRNVFLHGDDFMTMEESYELEFKELFHISMRLHKLIAILMLKAAGYSGYILNNAKVHDNISEKNLNEQVFIEI
jgi:hypothetical protein